MRVLCACALAMLSLAAVSHADPIDFNSESTGNKANGFTTDDSPIVHFYDTVNTGLKIYDASQFEGNGTQGLLVYDDFDGSMLKMTFDMNLVALSLDFGNDDPNYTNPGDYAFLKVYNNGVFVGMATVALNRNDLMDQSIGIVAPNFDTAYFYYGRASATNFTQYGFDPYTGGGQVNTGLIELIDNVNYRVPEPSLLALSGFGALVVAWRRRRKLAKKAA
jgi:hypothetical protein